MDKLASVLIAIFSGFWAIYGWLKFGIWVEDGPSGGFLPFFIGLMTFILALFGLVSKKSGFPEAITKRNFFPVIGVLVTILLIQIFGMIVSSGLFIIGWLVFLEKYNVKKASVIGVSTTIVIYIVFKFFLQVPFPQGLIGL